jgi:hypothetical protein
LSAFARPKQANAYIDKQHIKALFNQFCMSLSRS